MSSMNRDGQPQLIAVGCACCGGTAAREFESSGLSKQKQPALAGLMRRLPIPAIATSGTKPELSAALYCVQLVLDSGAGLRPRH
jgi:hypothetical protein